MCQLSYGQLISIEARRLYRAAARESLAVRLPLPPLRPPPPPRPEFMLLKSEFNGDDEGAKSPVPVPGAMGESRINISLLSRDFHGNPRAAS